MRQLHLSLYSLPTPNHMHDGCTYTDIYTYTCRHARAHTRRRTIPSPLPPSTTSASTATFSLPSQSGRCVCVCVCVWCVCVWCDNWASVSEPHTCDFNATFSLYIYTCDRHCTSNIAINISIFHLGLIRGARAYCPNAARRGAVGPTHC